MKYEIICKNENRFLNVIVSLDIIGIFYAPFRRDFHRSVLTSTHIHDVLLSTDVVAVQLKRGRRTGECVEYREALDVPRVG